MIIMSKKDIENCKMLMALPKREFIERNLAWINEVNGGEPFKLKSPADCPLARWVAYRHQKCSHELVGNTAKCPLCGNPTCPDCGNHLVDQISRVTGYLQAVSGWNEAKKQEYEDRHRYELSATSPEASTNIIPISTVDWYGLASTVVFLKGCPFRCPYCHNHELIKAGGEPDEAHLAEIEAEIKTNSLFVSAVVFSGGEPFEYPESLLRLAAFVHKLGLLVGVETNGYYTDRINRMIEAGLVDRIFMDLKAPLEKEAYKKVCGINAASHVMDSLKLCSKADVGIEVRTTVFEGIIGTPEDIQAIAATILHSATKAIPYTIQQGNPDTAWKSVSDREVTRDELLNLADVARGALSDVGILTKELGMERA